MTGGELDFNVIVKRGNTTVKNKNIPVIQIITKVQNRTICQTLCNSHYLDKLNYTDNDIAMLAKKKMVEAIDKHNLDTAQFLQSMNVSLNGVLYPDNKAWLIFLTSLEVTTPEEFQDKMNDVYVDRAEFNRELDEFFDSIPIEESK